jgi:hypothetical protein
MVIYPDDHRPAHVHCFVGGGEVVVLLDPVVRERERRGTVKAQEARRVLALVRERRGFLLGEWRERYPS